MEREAAEVVSHAGEVPVIEGELVTAIRTLAARAVGTKAIARELGMARNAVRRYRRAPVPAGIWAFQCEIQGNGKTAGAKSERKGAAAERALGAGCLSNSAGCLRV